MRKAKRDDKIVWGITLGLMIISVLAVVFVSVMH